MSVKVRIPTVLRNVTKGQGRVEASGSRLGELIANIDLEFPGFRSRVCLSDGTLGPAANFFVNGEDVKSLDGVDTRLNDGDEVFIVSAIAGG